jgi:hypothetical protein
MRIHRLLGVSLALALSAMAGCGDETEAPVCVTEPSFFYQPGIYFPEGGFGDVRETTRLTSDQYCRNSTLCAPTPEAGRAALRFGEGPTVVVRGCGLESLQRRHGLYGRILTYDSATGALIGASSYDDVTAQVAGCFDAAFQWGEGPPLPDTIDAAAKALLTHRRTCADVQIAEEPLTP